MLEQLQKVPCPDIMDALRTPQKNVGGLAVKAGARLNSIYGVRCEVYGNLKLPEVLLQSTFTHYLYGFFLQQAQLSH